MRPIVGKRGMNERDVPRTADTCQPTQAMQELGRVRVREWEWSKEATETVNGQTSRTTNRLVDGNAKWLRAM